MKIWKDGDKSRALCPSCQRSTTVIFERRSVEQSKPAVTAEDVLVAVCQECDGIAMIPHQSMPKLREAIQNPKETLNVRIPAHLEDVLYMLIDRVAQGWKNGTAPVLKYLLHEFGNNPRYARRVKVHLEDELAQGNAEADVSVRVPTHVLLMVDEMAELVGIANRSEVVRAILASAKKDVLDGQDPDLVDSMQHSIAAIA